MIAAVLEQLDLPARGAQQPELGEREIGVMDRERVELVWREPLPGGLNDDQAAVVSEPAPAALAAEESDHAHTLLLILMPLARALRVGVRSSPARGVAAAARGGKLRRTTHVTPGSAIRWTLAK